MGRLLTTTHSYNGATAVTLAENTYDEVGRLEQKELHNGYQDIDYCYNIRGWLTQMNDPTANGSNDEKFALKLFYDTDMTGTLTGNAQYNGNINGMMWRRTDNTKKGYNFSYDGLNRLTAADYGTYNGNWAAGNANDMGITSYDMNGNINGLTRKDHQGNTLDNFGYTLTGNRLASVSGTLSGSYNYDSNGNLTYDGPRSLTVSYFDELNLPKQYFRNDTSKVDYCYDAQAVKWSKTATRNGTPTTTLYYGPFIYLSGSLSIVLTQEGYYDPASSLYHYYLKDHLGNTRITFHYSGTTPVIDQEVEYYPFGTLFADNNLDKNIYLYNGKELNNEFFENYDYGARFYDPELGRWHVIDPLAESYQSYSPYNYTINNPINNTDPNGMWVETGKGYTTSDPNEIAKFLLNLFGIGPGNQPRNAEQAQEQSEARKALSNVGDKIEKLYNAEQEAISFLPGGVLLNGIMDTQTGHEGDTDFIAGLGFEAAGVFLPGVKFAKGPLKNVVKLSDDVIEFTQGAKELAKRVTAHLPEGFSRVKGLSKGEDIFSNGKVFITPDKTSHIGGMWKAAKKVEDLGSKTRRLGTYNENFVKIGD